LSEPTDSGTCSGAICGGTGIADPSYRSGTEVAQVRLHRARRDAHRQGASAKNADIPQVVLLLILNYDGGIIATRKSLQAQDLTMTAE
jgi:hypothetical protein